MENIKIIVYDNLNQYTDALDNAKIEYKREIVFNKFFGTKITIKPKDEIEKDLTHKLFKKY